MLIVQTTHARLVAFLVTMIASPCLAQSEPWTLAGIGDTQILVLSAEGGQVMNGMTQWIVDHRDEHNIQFVTQLGDLVTNGKENKTSPNNQTEWTRANTAMSKLDGVVPWAVAVGNHELDVVDQVNSGYSAYKAYFGPTTTGRFDQMQSYRGVSDNELNTFHIYKGGGREFLHLHVEMDTPDAAIAWAKEVIDDHPGMPTIVSTHIFEGTQHGPPNRPYLAGEGRNSANQIWDKLIKDNDQIFMVLNGHVGQRMHQTRVNAQGQAVFTIAQDFAVLDLADTNADRGTHGENEGWMRLYEFDETEDVIRVKTYSPSLDKFLTDDANEFTLPLDFTERFGPTNEVPEPASIITLSFSALLLTRRPRNFR